MARQTKNTSRVYVDDDVVFALYHATNGYAFMLDQVLLPAWVDLALVDVVAERFHTLAFTRHHDRFGLGTSRRHGGKFDHLGTQE